MTVLMHERPFYLDQGCNPQHLLRQSSIGVTGDGCCVMNIHRAKQIEILPSKRNIIVALCCLGY